MDADTFEPNVNYFEKLAYYDLLFRKKLKAALKYRGLTQQDFARLCNRKSQNASSKWLTLNEKYKSSPSAPELLVICDLLEVDLSYFKDEKVCFPMADLRENKA